MTDRLASIRAHWCDGTTRAGQSDVLWLCDEVEQWQDDALALAEERNQALTECERLHHHVALLRGLLYNWLLVKEDRPLLDDETRALLESTADNAGRGEEEKQ